MYQPFFDWFIHAYVQTNVALLQSPRFSAATITPYDRTKG